MDNKLTSSKLLEPDIKALVLNYLFDKSLIDGESIIISEYTIGGFDRRVDLVLLVNGKLMAFEIKSEADSLARLEGQINTYLDYFDKVIVVADKKFTSRIQEKSLRNVGLWEINSEKIKVKIRGRMAQKVSNERLIEMMDVVDLSKLAASCGIQAIRTRDNLSKSLLNMPNKKLRIGVEASLKRKYQKATKEFFKNTKGRMVLKDDIGTLSRFKALRDAERRKLENSRKFWLNQNGHVGGLLNYAAD